jgi:ferredoxin
VGKTLLECAQTHKVDLEGSCEGGGGPPEVHRTENWVETTYGEGPTCFWCHVQIPSTFNHLLPPMLKEHKFGLEQTWEDEVNTSSRLACMITLEKKHDGMVVYVPDAPPVDII